MTTTYTPQPGSLASRVCTFFVTHPEEELSSRDICTKFGVESINGISALLASPLAAQLVARIKDPDTGAMLWVAGPKLAASAHIASQPAVAFSVAVERTAANPRDLLDAREAAVAAPHPTSVPPPSRPAPKTPSARGATRLPAIDVAALVVKPGTPPVGRIVQRGRTRYDEVFDLLTEPGMCTELPIQYHATLDKAKTAYSKRCPGQRFSVRRLTASMCGVFRIA